MMKIDKKWVRIIGISLVAVTLVCLLSLNRFNHWYNSSLEAVSQSAEDVTFEVITGQTPEAIGKNLEDAGLIKSANAFNLYLNRSGQRTSLQAGIYRLNPGMPADDIADIIINGRVDARLLTIIPGLRVDQIKKVMIENGFDAGEVDGALNSKYSHPLLKSRPKGASLEGYIFPESIQVNSGVSPDEVFNQSFELLWKQITDDMKASFERQGLTLHEAIILASLVQMESDKPEDQPKIARVFANRLDIDMKLGSDVTFVYAAAIMGVEPRVDIDSPYNTRIYAGLPPGPVANFGINALKAVAFPADGDWLYFVSGDDGNTYFSKTFEEHEANTKKYCIELCQIY